MTPLTAEQRELAAQPLYLKLARQLAYRYARRCGQPADELLGPAYLGLVQAAGSYDPAREIKFPTHAQHRIRGSILDHLRAMRPAGYRRRWKNAPSILSLSAPTTAGSDSRSDLTVADLVLAGDLPVGWEVDSADAVAELVRFLHGSQRLVVRGYYLLATRGGGCKTVGRIMGVSESRVSQVLADALGTLRRRMHRAHPEG
jgi:RNA polymerase sigma factor (sigma-70 family)